MATIFFLKHQCGNINLIFQILPLALVTGYVSSIRVSLIRVLTVPIHLLVVLRLPKALLSKS